MFSAMRATFFVRLVGVSCSWYLAGAVDMKSRAEQPIGDEPLKSRAEQPIGDEPLKVDGPLRDRLPGISGCLATAPPSSNVRIQSLKTSNGSVYSRQLVTTADFPCFGNSASRDLPAATHIAACAEATAGEGLNSFQWEGGACKAFLAWRPRTRANCKDGGSKVVYVIEEPLKHFAGGEFVVSGEMRYDSPRAFLDISVQYLCGFGANKPKGYKLQWNNTNSTVVRRLDEGTTTYSLDTKTLCFISTNISLWALDQNGEVNSAECKVPFIKDSNLYALRTGGCIYHVSNASTYESATESCNSLGLTQFYEKVDGEAAAFLDALDALNMAAPVISFFVGLRLNVTSKQWIWQGGLEQPKVDLDVWDVNQPGPGDWGYAFKLNTHGSHWGLHSGDISNGLTCYADFNA